MYRHIARKENVKVALFLNISFTVIELIGGLLTNSLAILSDALHDFGDSITLGASWVAEKGAERKPDARRTFGYQRLSLFAALFAASVLVVGSLFILSKAIPRLLNPEHVNAQGMIGLAVIGIVFNGLGFFKLKRGQSMNEKVLSFHLLEDVLGWLAILLGGILIIFWDNHRIDPIITIGYTLFILWGVGKNIKETVNIFLQGVPSYIDVKNIKTKLLAIDGISDIHDIHVWSLEGETDVFTGHVVVSEELLKTPDKTRRMIKEELKEHHIEHSTIELESPEFCSGVECKN